MSSASPFFHWAELEPAFVLLLIVMVTFITCPGLFTFAEPCSFILVFNQRTVMLMHASDQTCSLKTFSEL